MLDGIDLSVSAAEVVALVAPSGSGKSTLLHIAGLLDTADAGSVTLMGQEVTALGDRRRTQARRAQVGFVYQFHHLLPEFTALENIVLPQLANGTDRAAAEAPRAGPAGHRGDQTPRRPPPRSAVGRRAAARRLLPRPGEPPASATGR